MSGRSRQYADVSGAVGSVDAHRHRRKAAAVFSLNHRPRGIATQQAASHEAVQHLNHLSGAFFDAP